MRFWVKNKIMTLGGSSFVTDEQGNKLFKIKGKIFSPTNKKIVCDPSGNKLFVVRNKFWHFFRRSAFVIGADGEKLLKITKKFWTNHFLVDNYDSEIVIDGTWTGWNLDVVREGKLAGKISRNLTLVRDSFQVDSMTNFFFHSSPLPVISYLLSAESRTQVNTCSMFSVVMSG